MTTRDSDAMSAEELARIEASIAQWDAELRSGKWVTSGHDPATKRLFLHSKALASTLTRLSAENARMREAHQITLELAACIRRSDPPTLSPAIPQGIALRIALYASRAALSQEQDHD